MEKGEQRTPGLGARLVTRAKYAISFFRPVQGSVPLSPMPKMPFFAVAATIMVSSGRGIAGSSGDAVVIVAGDIERVVTLWSGRATGSKGIRE